MKISIVTPSYNQGQFIEETIQSVIKQNYTNTEYIIIDGGSTDCTIDIIQKYEEHITYWESKVDRGQTHAINKGFQKASGDIVGWINSDDVLIDGALREVAKFFDNHQQIMFANGDTVRIDKNSNILTNKFHLKQNKWFANYGIFNIAQQSMFWRYELFDKIGFLNEDFHAEMDKEFLIRVFESGASIGRIDKPLGAIRLHEDTKTSRGNAIWREDKEKIRNKYNGKYDDTNINKVVQLVFIVLKFLKLKYLKELIFRINWKGKSVEKLSANS